MNGLLISLAVALTGAQDKPQTIQKKDLPKLAECVICTASGEGHEKEKPASGLMYKGKAYYFCSAKETDTFAKNPDFYLPLELPMPLPDFDLTDTSGKSWNADAFKGKLVLLDYWATWCKPCLALKPKLEAFHTMYSNKDFAVLSVSIDEKKPVFESFLKKNKWTNPVAYDSRQTWAGLRVASIPALFLVKDGKVVAEFRGKVDPKKIEESIKANL